MNDGMKAHVIDLLKSCPERRRKIALLHYFRPTVSSNMQLMTDLFHFLDTYERSPLSPRGLTLLSLT